MLGTLAAMAGLVFLVGYAIPGLTDLPSSTVSLREYIIGNAIGLLLALGAFIMAFRLLSPFKKSNRATRGA
jgi:hypothetical protein